MKNTTAKRIRLVYGIVTGLAAVAAGICLIAACLGIYHSGGEQTYTAEKIAAAFAPIAAPVYLALALAIGGLILDFVLPLERSRQKPGKNYAATLRRLLEKRDVATGDPDVLQGILRAENTRRLHWLIATALLVIGSIVFLIFGADPDQFGMTGINESMARAMYIMIPCLAVPFGWAVFASYYNKVSLQKQIELVKQLPVVEKAAVPAPADCDRAIAVTRWVLVAVALALLIYGYLAGGTADVITKAVNICTECVGLG